MAVAGLLLVLLSLGGTSAQITPNLTLSVVQPQGIANVSLVTATAFLNNAGVGIAGQNITFSTVGNTGARELASSPGPSLSYIRSHICNYISMRYNMWSYVFSAQLVKATLLLVHATFARENQGMHSSWRHGQHSRRMQQS